MGIYSQAEAARLLRMTPGRLRRWVNGYTYWLQYRATETRRRRAPVIQKSDLPVLDGKIALSFLELMELRIIKALVDREAVSLQRVRKAAAVARNVFETPHPFASRTVYAERNRIFASVAPSRGDADVIELAPGRTFQLVMGRMIPFLQEIDFDPISAMAHRWWPMGRGELVVLDPDILFGAPAIAGTRVATAVAAGMAESNTPEAAAAAYQIPLEGVEASLRFEKLLAAA